MKKYSKLFSPLTIGTMTIPNRIVMMPMGSNFAAADGSMSEKHKQYYELRAKGGTGLIIVENACVSFPLGSNGTTQLRIDHDQFIPGFYDLTERIHNHNGVISIQLNHAGASASPERIGTQPASASNLPSRPGGTIPRPFTESELEEIAVSYGKAAKRAQMAGFDSVEVHGGHSYLISQFLSPIYNNRTDKFGGSAENRARFPRMVLHEVRKATGGRLPISLRISADEIFEAGNHLEDTLEILSYLDEYVDFYNVSAALNGCGHYQIDAMHLADGWRSFMAKAVKEKFNKPVITCGNFRDPAVAENVLQANDADLIGIGRGLIADPEWGNKAFEGRDEDIRKCVSCNIGCAGSRIGLNRPIHCTINPSLCSEIKYTVKKPCNVVVIGGGTAGLEAACTAAESGCTTFLIEKEERTGGLARTISRLPDKKRICDFPDFLENRAKKLSNLFILNNTEADCELLKKLNPNIIVNATGSVPLLPPIEGLKSRIDCDDYHIQSINGLLNSDLNQYEKGKQVVVVGGGAVGLDVIEFFSHLDAKMTIIEMADGLGRDLDPISKSAFDEVLTKHNVNILTNTKLTCVNDSSFTVIKENEQLEIPFDYGFVCLGMRANAPIFECITNEFAAKGVQVINIGDSKRARRIIDGIHEGSIMLIEQLKKFDSSNR